MCTAVRTGTKDLGLHLCGFDPDLIGVHSLRSGGAMAMKLAGTNDTTIQKHGRWTSMTFLQYYIHNQIAPWSDDLANKMSSPIPFVNIASFK